MTDAAAERVLAALRRVVDPDLRRDLVDLGFVKDLRVDGAEVSFTIELTTPACPVRAQLEEQARAAVAALPGVTSVRIAMTSRVRQAKSAADLLPTVKNLVVVSSGKGGVGKTTVAVGIAAALAKDGAAVGLLDLDVWGPNVPAMMGAEGPLETVNRKIQPIVRHGVRTMSIAYFLKPGEPVIWRGAMAHGALRQFCRDVEWGALDYLVLDLPPGTGDVPLSVAQTIPPTGAVIVATPQRVALLDVEKSVRMYAKLNVPVLGLVENMSVLACPHCAKPIDLYGAGGAERAAAEWGVPFLGRIPIDPEVRAGGDAGTPVVLSRPESDAGRAVQAIARAVAARISTLHGG